MSIEKRGIIASVIGASSMAIWGLFMAWYTKSYAIFLDGSFNLISAALTGLSIILVSKMSKQKYSKKHPLGYYMYEAFMVFVKGIFILGLIIMSFTSNLKIFLAGGKELDIFAMLVYGVPALIVNIATFLFCYFSYKKEKTSLLEVEVRAWTVNTLITSLVVVSLFIVYFLQNTRLNFLNRYIDQILIMILCFITIGDPIILIRNAFKELMLRSADSKYIKPFLDILENEKIEKEGHFIFVDISILKIGRASIINMYLKPKTDSITLKEYTYFQSSITSIARSVYKKDVEIAFFIIDELESDVKEGEPLPL